MKREEIFVQRDLYKSTFMIQQMKEKYTDVKVKIIEYGIVEANYCISKKLDIPLASKVWYSIEAVFIEGYPVSYAKYYVDLNEVEGLDTLDINSVGAYEFITKHLHVHTIITDEEFLIVKANEQERKYLQLNENEEVSLLKGNMVFEQATKQCVYFEISCLTTLIRLRSVGENV